MALLMVTHDLSIVRQIADRISVMRDGEIVESGGTGALIANPTHPYTKELLDADPSQPGRGRR
jgi:ABC-type microcin C transport system duplicated ATPase subunit YejF